MSKEILLLKWDINLIWHEESFPTKIAFLDTQYFLYQNQTKQKLHLEQKL